MTVGNVKGLSDVSAVSATMANANVSVAGDLTSDFKDYLSAGNVGAASATKDLADRAAYAAKGSDITNISADNVKKAQPSDTDKQIDTKTDNKTETGKASGEKQDVVKADKTEAKSEVKEAAGEALEEVKQIVMDKLGLTDEEFERLLSELGLNIADLLMPQNMAQLLATVTDNEVTDILTDSALSEELTDIMTDISQVVNTAANEQKMPVNDFIGEMNTVASEPAFEVNALDEEANSGMMQSDKPSVSVRADAQVQTATVTIDPESGKQVKITSEDGKITDESVSFTGLKPENEQYAQTQNSGFDAKSDDKGANEQSIASQVTNNLTQAVENVLSVGEDFAASYTTVSATEIVEQVINQIKVSVTAETQSMELQLNPENLGKIALNVETKNGVVTATITATSEAARAAIADQVSVLRENLNNQGLKVEAVEVTLASPDFNPNYNGNNEQQQNNSAPGRRRFAGPDTPSEEEIDEALEREMMAANGNSVNFTA